MELNSNLNFTTPLMFYLQTEAVLKASFFQVEAASLRHYSQNCIQLIGTVLGEHS